MAGLNKVILIGYLGNEPEIISNDGSEKLSFRLITDSPFSKNGENSWEMESHNIVIPDKMVALACRLLTKGKLIYIEGKAITTCVKDERDIKRYHTKIVASYFKLLG
ncbi:single-stranded DNA-binding protein, partial [Mucilaginibacter sp. 5B2]|nr:single-stranded DNA-binding protein [Mucilaginibacter sp. 5B2]